VCFCYITKDWLIVFVCVYFWALHSISLVCLSVLFPTPHSLDDYRNILSLDVERCQFSNLVLYYCVGYSESFSFLYKLCNQFFIIHKITCWDFDWYFFEFVDEFVNSYHLYNIWSSHIRRWIVFSLVKSSEYPSL
jgi:hypothetical protein